MESLIERSINNLIRQKDEEIYRELIRKEIKQIDRNKWLSYLSLATSIISIFISIFK